MSDVTDASAQQNRPEKIGPGTVILVVGPSGAGKDTLIDGARLAFADDTRIRFPRRLVTRAAGAAEDHDTITEAEYEAGITDGSFTIHWQAHGLGYALPRSVSDDVKAGRIVLFNASRAIVSLLRERFRDVVVVGVDAPPAIRAKRLAGRGRESKAEIEARLSRTVEADVAYDRVIVNDGSPAAGTAALVDIIRQAICR